jgi:hypothetical protein
VDAYGGGSIHESEFKAGTGLSQDVCELRVCYSGNSGGYDLHSLGEKRIKPIDKFCFVNSQLVRSRGKDTLVIKVLHDNSRNRKLTVLLVDHSVICREQIFKKGVREGRGAVRGQNMGVCTVGVQKP